MSRIIYDIHRAQQALDDLYNRALAQCKITSRQLAVLEAIPEDGASQTELVTITEIDRSTMADIVRRLLKAGLVKRRRNPKDCRAYNVTLTSIGFRALAAAQEKTEEIDAIVEGRVGKSTRRDLLSLRQLKAAPEGAAA